MNAAFSKAMKRLWTGRCDIYEYKSSDKGIVETSLVKVSEAIPCRISFEKGQSSNSSTVQSSKEQYTKLILSNDIEIKAGSLLEVEQNGRRTRYKSSGEPAIYSSHQEILLELCKEWC